MLATVFGKQSLALKYVNKYHGWCVPDWYHAERIQGRLCGSHGTPLIVHEAWAFPQWLDSLYKIMAIMHGSCDQLKEWSLSVHCAVYNESERSFSQLKLLKGYHRSTMSADRLNGLALMKINRTRCEKLHRSQSN